jgi:hypothetical protein
MIEVGSEEALCVSVELADLDCVRMKEMLWKDWRPLFYTERGN